MKTTMKLFLILSLFCSVALADDGDMNSGNKSGGSGGGLTCAECVITEPAPTSETGQETEDPFTRFFRDFFFMIIG